MLPLGLNSVRSGQLGCYGMSQLKKYFCVYPLLLVVIVSFFLILVYFVDMLAVDRHEKAFNKQQLVQTLLVRKILQQTIATELSASRLIARSAQMPSNQGNLPFEQQFDKIRKTNSFLVAALRIDSGGSIRDKLCATGYPAARITKLATTWAKEHGLGKTKTIDSVVPPFYVSKRHQLMGVVFAQQTPENASSIVVIFDIGKLLIPYIETIRSGTYGSGYALDDNGVVLYDNEREIIGRNVFDGMHTSYPGVEALDRRILSEDTGIASYSFTVARGKELDRKLVAWNTVKFKGRKIIIALSSPDSEINGTLKELRNSYISIGAFLVLFLAAFTLFFLRKKERQAFLESEMRFRQLANATWEGIILYKDGLIRLANEQFYTIFGYCAEKNVGKQKLSLFFNPDVVDLIESTSSSGGLDRYETVGRRADGTLFPLEIRVREADYQGDVVRIAALRDISEHKKILETVRAGERNCREIFNASNDAILIHEIKTGKLTDVNAAALEMFGYSHEDMLQRSLSDFGEEMLAAFDADTANKKVRIVVWKAKRKDGASFWCEAAMHMAKISGMECILAVLRDVSSRRQYEENLQLSERYYKSLFENTGTATVILDQDGIVRSCNTKFEQLCGYSRGEVESRMRWSDFVGSCDFGQIDAYHPRRLKEGRLASEDYDCTLRNKEGELKFVRIEVEGIAETSDKVASFLDITKRITMERDLAAFNASLERIVASRTAELAKKAADLEAANRRLTEVDELKSAFVSSVSHELRTPLTSIRGFAKIIYRDFSKFFRIDTDASPDKLLRSQRIVDNLGIVLREGERLTRLINDMLDLNKIESGKMDWHDEWMDPYQAVQMAVDAVRGQFEEKQDVDLQVDMGESLPQVYVNPDRLQQVIINLLNNAAKFTEQGSVTLTVRANTHFLVFTVADTGAGIPEDELKDIFKKFHKSRVPLSGPFPTRGTGLGLAICKEIVAHYKGDIKVESAAGNGSTFTFRIPLE